MLKDSIIKTLIITSLIFDIFILTGTTYLIGWCNWSKWTMVLTIFFMFGWSPAINFKSIKEQADDTKTH